MNYDFIRVYANLFSFLWICLNLSPTSGKIIKSLHIQWKYSSNKNHIKFKRTVLYVTQRIIVAMHYHFLPKPPFLFNFYQFQINEFPSACFCAPRDWVVSIFDLLMILKGALFIVVVYFLLMTLFLEQFFSDRLSRHDIICLWCADKVSYWLKNVLSDNHSWNCPVLVPKYSK